MSDDRRLRGKTAYVVCASVSDETSVAFMGMFLDMFKYLGMHFGGLAHVNCRDGYSPSLHDSAAVAFATLVKDAESGGTYVNDSGAEEA